MVEKELLFSPKKKVIIAQEIVEDIKRAIIKRNIKPGEKINETKIAKAMGVSRSPVRDALQQLRKEGIVVNIPYKGTFVSMMGIKDIEDMYELRALLEAYSLEKIIDCKNNEKLIKKLKLIVYEIENAIKNKNFKKLSEKDVEFHREICKFTSNNKLIEIWEGFQSQFQILIDLEASFYERLKLLAEEHEEILNLIINKRLVEAQKKTKEHILQALEFLKKSMLTK